MNLFLYGLHFPLICINPSLLPSPSCPPFFFNKDLQLIVHNPQKLPLLAFFPTLNSLQSVNKSHSIQFYSESQIKEDWSQTQVQLMPFLHDRKKDNCSGEVHPHHSTQAKPFIFFFLTNQNQPSLDLFTLVMITTHLISQILGKYQRLKVEKLGSFCF